MSDWVDELECLIEEYIPAFSNIFDIHCPSSASPDPSDPSNVNSTGQSGGLCNPNQCFPCSSPSNGTEECGGGNCIPKSMAGDNCRGCKKHQYFCNCDRLPERENPPSPHMSNSQQEPGGFGIYGKYPEDGQACTHDPMGRHGQNAGTAYCNWTREEINTAIRDTREDTQTFQYNGGNITDLKVGNSINILNIPKDYLNPNLNHDPGPDLMGIPNFNKDLKNLYEYSSFLSHQRTISELSCDGNNPTVPQPGVNFNQLFNNKYCKIGDLLQFDGQLQQSEGDYNRDNDGMNLDITQQYNSQYPALGPTDPFRIPLTYEKVNLPPPDQPNDNIFPYSESNQRRLLGDIYGEKKIIWDKTISSPYCDSEHGVVLPFKITNACIVPVNGDSILDYLNNNGYISPSDKIDGDIIKKIIDNHENSGGELNSGNLNDILSCSSPNYYLDGDIAYECGGYQQFSISGCKPMDCDKFMVISPPSPGKILTVSRNTKCYLGDTQPPSGPLATASPCATACSFQDSATTSCRTDSLRDRYENMGCDWDFNGPHLYVVKPSPEKLGAKFSMESDSTLRKCCVAKGPISGSEFIEAEAAGQGDIFRMAMGGAVDADEVTYGGFFDGARASGRTIKRAGGSGGGRSWESATMDEEWVAEAATSVLNPTDASPIFDFYKNQLNVMGASLHGQQFEIHPYDIYLGSVAVPPLSIGGPSADSDTSDKPDYLIWGSGEGAWSPSNSYNRFKNLEETLNLKSIKNKYLNNKGEQLKDLDILRKGNVIDSQNTPILNNVTCATHFSNTIQDQYYVKVEGESEPQRVNEMTPGQAARAVASPTRYLTGAERYNNFCKDTTGDTSSKFLKNKKMYNLKGSPINEGNFIENMKKNCCYSSPITLDLSSDSIDPDTILESCRSPIQPQDFEDNLDPILESLYLSHNGGTRDGFSQYNTGIPNCFSMKAGYECNQGLTYDFPESSPNTIVIKTCEHKCNLDQESTTDKLQNFGSDETTIVQLNSIYSSPSASPPSSPAVINWGSPIDILHMNDNLMDINSGNPESASGEGENRALYCSEQSKTDTCHRKRGSECSISPECESVTVTINGAPKNLCVPMSEGNQGSEEYVNYFRDLKNLFIQGNDSIDGEMNTGDNQRIEDLSLNSGYHGPYFDCESGNTNVKGCDAKFIRTGTAGNLFLESQIIPQNSDNFESCSRFIEYHNMDTTIEQPYITGEGPFVGEYPDYQNIGSICTTENNVLFTGLNKGEEKNKYCKRGYYPVNNNGFNTGCSNLGEYECYKSVDCFYNIENSQCLNIERARCVEIAQPGTNLSNSEGMTYINNLILGESPAGKQILNQDIGTTQCTVSTNYQIDSDRTISQSNDIYENYIISSPVNYSSSPLKTYAEIYKGHPGENNASLKSLMNCNSIPDLFSDRKLNQNLIGPGVSSTQPEGQLRFTIKNEHLIDLQLTPGGVGASPFNFVKNGLTVNNNKICNFGSILQFENNNGVGDEVNLICAPCPQLPLKNENPSVITGCGYNPDVLNTYSPETLRTILGDYTGSPDLKRNLKLNDNEISGESQDPISLCQKGYSYVYEDSNISGSCQPNTCTIPIDKTLGVVSEGIKDTNKFGGEQIINQSLSPLDQPITYNPSPVPAPPKYGYQYDRLFETNENYFCSGNPVALKEACDSLHGDGGYLAFDHGLFVGEGPNTRGIYNTKSATPDADTFIFTSSPCQEKNLIDPTSYLKTMEACLGYTDHVDLHNPFIWIPTDSNSQLSKTNGKMSFESNLNDFVHPVAGNNPGVCLRVTRNKNENIIEYLNDKSFYCGQETPLNQRQQDTINSIWTQNCSPNTDKPICSFIFKGQEEGDQISSPSDDTYGLIFNNIQSKLNCAGFSNMEGFSNSSPTLANPIDSWYKPPDRQTAHKIETEYGDSLEIQGNIGISTENPHPSIQDLEGRCGWSIRIPTSTLADKEKYKTEFSRICNRNYYQGMGIGQDLKDAYQGNQSTTENRKTSYTEGSLRDNLDDLASNKSLLIQDPANQIHGNEKYFSTNYPRWDENTINYKSAKNDFQLIGTDAAPPFYFTYNSEEMELNSVNKSQLDDLYEDKNMHINAKVKDDKEAISFCTSTIKENINNNTTDVICSYNILGSRGSPSHTEVTPLDILKQPYIGHLTISQESGLSVNYPDIPKTKEYGSTIRDGDTVASRQVKNVDLKYPALYNEYTSSPIPANPLIDLKKLSISEFYIGNSSPPIGDNTLIQDGEFRKVELIEPSVTEERDYNNKFLSGTSQHYSCGSKESTATPFTPDSAEEKYINHRVFINKSVFIDNGGHVRDNWELPADCGIQNIFKTNGDIIEASSAPTDSPGSRLVEFAGVPGKGNSFLGRKINEACIPGSFDISAPNSSSPREIEGLCLPCPINMIYDPSSDTCNKTTDNRFSLPFNHINNEEQEHTCPNGYIDSTLTSTGDTAPDGFNIRPLHSLTKSLIFRGGPLEQATRQKPGLAPGDQSQLGIDRRIYDSNFSEPGILRRNDRVEVYDKDIYETFLKFAYKTNNIGTTNFPTTEEQSKIRAIAKHTIVNTCGPPLTADGGIRPANWTDTLVQNFSVNRDITRPHYIEGSPLPNTKYNEVFPKGGGLHSAGEDRDSPRPGATKDFVNYFRTSHMRQSEKCANSGPWLSPAGTTHITGGNSRSPTSKADWIGGSVPGATGYIPDTDPGHKIIDTHLYEPAVFEDNSTLDYAYTYRNFLNPTSCASCIWGMDYPVNWAEEWGDDRPFSAYDDMRGNRKIDSERCYGKYNVKVSHFTNPSENTTPIGNQPGAAWVPETNITYLHWGTGGSNAQNNTNANTRNNTNSKTYPVCDLYQNGGNWGWSNSLHGDSQCDQHRPDQ